MPNKKTQRRPNRPRNRTPRPAPSSVRQPVEEEVLESVAAVPAAAAPTPTSVARAVGAPARRAPRRSTAAVINYEYLSRDLKMLGVLAPAMVVLVILAFIFIH